MITKEVLKTWRSLLSALEEGKLQVMIDSEWRNTETIYMQNGIEAYRVAPTKCYLVGDIVTSKVDNSQYMIIGKRVNDRGTQLLVKDSWITDTEMQIHFRSRP